MYMLDRESCRYGYVYARLGTTLPVRLVIGKLGFWGLEIELFYGVHYVHTKREVLQFPIIQAEPETEKSQLEVGGNIHGIFDLGPGSFSLEAVFVSSQPGTKCEEDDGYLIFFVDDENTGQPSDGFGAGRGYRRRPGGRMMGGRGRRGFGSEVENSVGTEFGTNELGYTTCVNPPSLTQELFVVHQWRFFKHILHGDNQNVSSSNLNNQYNAYLWKFLFSGTSEKEAKEILKVL
ncbi:Carotenoid 9,10(9',10')-cleavage dioxygenase 1 [Capsicum chinense]|nr:Carotenoid 9,10(9',10')-cleavage dioxygenase 1 [Capsicum chinense]